MLIKTIMRLRRAVCRWFYTAIVKHLAAAYGPELHVNGWSVVNGQTRLGRNVNFNGIEVAGRGAVTIGDNFHSGPGCLLITQIHDFDHGEAIPYGSNYILKDIVIEDNVWLGSRVIVLGGVRIGEGAIIQAGSCVVCDIPKYAIAGGHPARVFSQRDAGHYEKLKAEGRFH